MTKSNAILETFDSGSCIYAYITLYCRLKINTSIYSSSIRNHLCYWRSVVITNRNYYNYCRRFFYDVSTLIMRIYIFFLSFQCFFFFMICRFASPFSMTYDKFTSLVFFRSIFRRHHRDNISIGNCACIFYNQVQEFVMR